MAPGRLPRHKQPGSPQLSSAAAIKAVSSLLQDCISIQRGWRGHITHTHKLVLASDRCISSKGEREVEREMEGAGGERERERGEGITCPTNRSLGHCSGG